MRLNPALFHGPHAALRREVTEVLAAGVDAVEPEAAVIRALPGALRSHGGYRHVVIAALGKAAAAMARGAVAVLGAGVSRGVIVTKDGHGERAPAGLEVLETAHPVPDARSLAAGARLLALAAGADPRDLLLVLVSGGASALAEALAPGVTLDELRVRTDRALRSGAPIAEVNAARRGLSRFKGGGLARAARGPVLALCLSDVAGDDPAVIGSGPAWTGPGGPRHVVVASLAQALGASARAAAQRGFSVVTLPERLEGEAREAHGFLCDWLDVGVARGGGGARPRRLVLAGGETTVRVGGSGRGGRNQELALAAIPALATRPGTVLAALGTDGTDGPTDAAGGLVDSESAARAQVRRIDLEIALANNDAYAALAALGDLVLTGPTGTNVGDLVALAL